MTISVIKRMLDNNDRDALEAYLANVSVDNFIRDLKEFAEEKSEKALLGYFNSNGQIV